MGASLRDNLLVTVGLYAGEMNCRCIDLPEGLDGEDALADYAVVIVREYMKTGHDTPFCEFVEQKLLEKFRKGAYRRRRPTSYSASKAESSSPSM